MCEHVNMSAGLRHCCHCLSISILSFFLMAWWWGMMWCIQLIKKCICQSHSHMSKFRSVKDEGMSLLGLLRKLQGRTTSFAGIPFLPLPPPSSLLPALNGDVRAVAPQSSCTLRWPWKCKAWTRMMGLQVEAAWVPGDQEGHPISLTLLPL